MSAFRAIAQVALVCCFIALLLSPGSLALLLSGLRWAVSLSSILSMITVTVLVLLGTLSSHRPHGPLETDSDTKGGWGCFGGVIEWFMLPSQAGISGSQSIKAACVFV